LEIDYLGLVSRWLHILAAMVAVGGTVFQRVALVPSVGTLTDDARRQLVEAIRQRWSRWVMMAILFLLASGLYNFVVIAKQLPESGKGLYHGLFGVKFLLAIAIFFVASALAGRSEAFARIRQNARIWLTINLVMAVVLVCISGFLRTVPRQAAATQPDAGARAEPSAPAGWHALNEVMGVEADNPTRSRSSWAQDVLPQLGAENEGSRGGG
jgi:uncharacterized membrane protein